MIRFIDSHKDRRSGQLRWGIEPIAKVLGIAPSTYQAVKSRPPSARAIRDAELRPEILRVWEQNLSVYGADKIWDQLNKDGIDVARCTVERLMADLGLQGCRRGRIWVRTTEGDDRLDRPADLVERQFRAPAPATARPRLTPQSMRSRVRRWPAHPNEPPAKMADGVSVVLR